MNTTELPRPPVSHSVLHPELLAGEVARRYTMRGEVRGFLLYRGMNDVYLMEDDTEKTFAFRVWRQSWRDIDVVEQELQIPDYLNCRNFPASTPLRTHDGSLYFKVASPEEPRTVAPYTWAPGKTFGEALYESTAKRIGKCSRGYISSA